MKTKYPFFFSFFVLLLISQLPNPNAIDGKDKAINWTALDNLSSKKMTIIYIYKKDNQSSNRMYNTTFMNAEIIKYGNKKFNFVKLDADSQVAAINNLGITLQEYPTTIILDRNQIILQDIAGYLSIEEFDVMMNYYGEEAYKEKTWKAFQKKYKEENDNASPMYDGVRK